MYVGLNCSKIFVSKSCFGRPPTSFFSTTPLPPILTDLFTPDRRWAAVQLLPIIGKHRKRAKLQKSPSTVNKLHILMCTLQQLAHFQQINSKINTFKDRVSTESQSFYTRIISTTLTVANKCNYNTSKSAFSLVQHDAARVCC